MPSKHERSPSSPSNNLALPRPRLASPGPRLSSPGPRPASPGVVSELELAEALNLLDEQDEGPPGNPRSTGVSDDKEEDESGAIKARPALSIKEKAKPKAKGKTQRAGSAGRSNTSGKPAVATRSAFIMPSNKYPILVEGARDPQNTFHYVVIIDGMWAVQYGSIFSSAGWFKASRRRPLCDLRHSSWCHPANWNLIVTVFGPKPTMPTTISTTGRSEMPSLKCYHADLSPLEMKSANAWYALLNNIQRIT